MKTNRTNNKIKNVSVKIKSIENNYAMLSINPYDEKVKDVIKTCSGRGKYDYDRKLWAFDIMKLDKLAIKLTNMLYSSHIEACLCNMEIVEERIEYLKNEKKLNNPSLYDYSSNPLFYNSLHNTDSSLQKSANIAEEKDEYSAQSFVNPKLSSDSCAFRHLCKRCCGECVDFLSAAEAFSGDNNKTKEKQLNDNNIFEPDTIWYGESKAAYGSGYFKNGPKGLFIIKEGSRMSDKVAVSLASSMVELRDHLKKKVVDKNNVFTHDYPFNSVEQATSVLTGSTSHWKTFWKAEGTEEYNCVGGILDHNTPAFAYAVINGHKIIGLPALNKGSEGKNEIGFMILSGNFLPVHHNTDLTQKQKETLKKIRELADQDNRLKTDFMFNSPDEAAQILSGNSKATSAIWHLTEDITMQDVLALHSMDKFADHKVYHLEKQTLGTIAAMYIDENNDYVLMKGSIISPFLYNSCPDKYKHEYREMHENGIVVNSIITCDIHFRNSSPAAAACTGQSMNGSKEWKSLSGEYLKAENRSKKAERI